MFRDPDRRRIYLLRHGEAAYLKPDGTPVEDTRIAGLTANGRAQARAHGELLAGIEFDRAICSGLARTVETATLVLGARSTPVLEVMPALAEIEGGDRHQPIADLEAWLAHVANPWADAAHPEARFLGGERFVDFEARVVPAFRALIDDPGWRQLLIVAHGGVNRLLLNHVMNLPWQGTVSVEQDACCINIVDVDRRQSGAPRYLVRGVNITGYNLAKAGILLTDMELAAQRLATRLGRTSS
jgi:probable phosphoglycerate mutase